MGKVASSKPVPSKPVSGGLDVVVERNDFYRDGYRKMQTITAISAAASLAAVLIAGIAIFAKPAPKFFATDREGRIIPLVPLNQPYQNSGAVLGWASEAIMKTFSMDFVHYRRSLNESREYFTEDGWNGFLQAMQDSGVGPSMKEQKQVVSATPTDAAVIVGQGELRGSYTWKIKQPFLITFSTNTESRSQKVVVSLTVLRVPTTVNAKGLGIQQIIMEDAV